MVEQARCDPDTGLCTATPPLRVECAHAADGFFTMPRTLCRAYYGCHNGTRKDYTCPADSYFDITSQVTQQAMYLWLFHECNFPASVVCCTNVARKGPKKVENITLTYCTIVKLNEYRTQTASYRVKIKPNLKQSIRT